jgi:hypothetical protein
MEREPDWYFGQTMGTPRKQTSEVSKTANSGEKSTISLLLYELQQNSRGITAIFMWERMPKGESACSFHHY